MKRKSSLIVSSSRYAAGMDRRLAARLIILVLLAPFVLIAIGVNFTEQARVAFELLGLCRGLLMYLIALLCAYGVGYLVKQFQ